MQRGLGCQLSMPVRRDFPPVLRSREKRLLAYSDRVFVIFDMTSCVRTLQALTLSIRHRQIARRDGRERARRKSTRVA